MKKRLIYIGILVLIVATNSHAAFIEFTDEGTLVNTNDVAYFQFTFDTDVSDVNIWTDSYNDGANFDPSIVLWGSGDEFLRINSDNSRVNPATQSTFDAGMSFPLMLAGQYTLSVLIDGNMPVGNSISQGFTYDATPTLPISSGGNWRLWVTGNSVEKIPEPGVLLLLLVAVGSLAFNVKKQSIVN